MKYIEKQIVALCKIDEVDNCQAITIEDKKGDNTYLKQDWPFYIYMKAGHCKVWHLQHEK